MNVPTKSSIVWIRGELRLGDNSALIQACLRSTEVVPLLNLDFLTTGNSNFDKWTFQAVLNMKSELRNLGSNLVVSSGSPIETLLSVCKAFEASQVYWVQSLDPLDELRDIEIKGKLQASGIRAEITQNPDRKLICQTAGELTSFKRYWDSINSTRISPPDQIPRNLKPPGNWAEFAIEHSLKNLDTQKGKSRTGGITKIELSSKRLNQIVSTNGEGKLNPKSSLSAPAISDISSVYLSHGQFSIREAAYGALTSSINSGGVFASEFGRQLSWRGFAKSFMVHHPMLDSELKDPRFNEIKWNNSNDLLDVWKSGQTGYPLVDAAMRQLNETGWLPNRARLVAASFLVKHLLINWQHGAEWFMKKLFDADKASNYFNWHWVTGCGINSNPYFRILNPTLQSKKHDPTGEYIKTWVPELSELKPDNIHTPWLCDVDTLSKSHISLNRTYPRPVVDHMTARKAAIDAYSTALNKNKVS